MPALLVPPRRPTTAPVEDVTRRDVLRGTGALSLAALLAACGADPAAEPAARSTRTVRDAVDDVEVPVSPQRVVVMSQSSALEIGSATRRCSRSWACGVRRRRSSAPGAGIEDLSAERICELDADAVFVFGIDGDAGKRRRPGALQRTRCGWASPPSRPVRPASWRASTGTR